MRFTGHGDHIQKEKERDMNRNDHTWDDFVRSRRDTIGYRALNQNDYERILQARVSWGPPITDKEAEQIFEEFKDLRTPERLERVLPIIAKSPELREAMIQRWREDAPGLLRQADFLEEDADGYEVAADMLEKWPTN
jgi:hypothetical protein